MDKSRHRERQINDLDNRIYLIENRIKGLKEEKNRDDVRAVTAFASAYHRGCLEAERELKTNFPESYKQLKLQNKE